MSMWGVASPKLQEKREINTLVSKLLKYEFILRGK